jgi:hypothetical protein
MGATPKTNFRRTKQRPILKAPKIKKKKIVSK